MIEVIYTLQHHATVPLADSTVRYLQASAVLSEGSLDLQLLLNCSVSQLGAVALHLSSCPEGALKPPRLVFHILQLALQPVKLWLTL